MRMMNVMLVLLLVVSFLMTGCEGMTPTQKTAGIGALGGTALGALVGKKEDRGRNAMIGAGAGALIGGLYGKNKENQQLKRENASYRDYIRDRERREEVERLRDENARLKGKLGIKEEPRYKYEKPYHRPEYQTEPKVYERRQSYKTPPPVIRKTTEPDRETVWM